jgi:hypothetical protein
MPEHRIELVQLVDTLCDALDWEPEAICKVGLSLLVVRKELVEGRI